MGFEDIDKQARPTRTYAPPSPQTMRRGRRARTGRSIRRGLWQLFIVLAAVLIGYAIIYTMLGVWGN